jgi:hypothetical protein
MLQHILERGIIGAEYPTPKSHQGRRDRSREYDLPA